MQPHAPFANPRQLVECLQTDRPPGRTAARAFLRRLFEPGLLAAVRVYLPNGAQSDWQLWADQALFWQEFRLRDTPIGRIPTTWPAFINGEPPRLHGFVAALVEPPPPPTNTSPTNRSFDSGPFHIRVYSRPYHDVGGDRFSCAREYDGSLWVLLADAVGHGRIAHLVAEGIGHLWDLPQVAQARANAQPPLFVLGLISRELAPALPRYRCPEALLARFHPPPDRRVTVASAGGMGVVRCDSGTVQLRQLESSLLGFESVTDDVLRQEQTWPLADGEELVLTTDGMLNQPTQASPVRRFHSSMESLAVPAGRSLFDLLVQELQGFLGRCRQEDDITLVTILRRKGGAT